MPENVGKSSHEKLTVQGLEIGRTFHVCPRTVHIVTLPVRPYGGILEIIVELAVL